MPQASDRARSTLPLSALARIQGNVEGLHSWELAGKEGERGYQETDGPAYLVTRPDIQVGRRKRALAERRIPQMCCVRVCFLVFFLALRLRFSAWGTFFKAVIHFRDVFLWGDSFDFIFRVRFEFFT